MTQDQGGKSGRGRLSSLRPPASVRRDSQAAAALIEALPDYVPHVASPEQRMRHDGRSALHSIVGFAELLESEALGPLSLEQQLSLVHIKSSAARLFELLESSIDIAQSAQPPLEGTQFPLCMARVVESTVRNLAREQPSPQLTFEGPLLGTRVPVMSEPELITKLVRNLVQAMAGEQRELWLWMTHTDLHAILTIGVPFEDDSVMRSLPAMQVELADLQASAQLLNNRDFVRLKRCEALVTRQRGRLLVAPDMSRVRVMIPKHGG